MDFNVLVLGPGGNKGVVELGALEYCEFTGKFNNITTIAGVSVGAIIGLLMTCGYTISEILTQALSTNLLDSRNLLTYSEIPTCQGLFSQKTFRKDLTDLVRLKFGIVPNLEQLHSVTGKEFMAVTTNVKVNTEKNIPTPEYFSYKTQPYLSCVEAALMSSNIPGLFSKIEYNNGIYVDGALSNPYPVDQYDIEGNRILGISVLGIPATGGSNVVDYFVQSIHAPISQLRDRLQKSASNRVLNMNIPVVLNNTLNLTPNKEDKNKMFTYGFSVAKNFFDTSKPIMYPEDSSAVVFD